jgi:uncharacterized RDD family membrane protein YckC
MFAGTRREMPQRTSPPPAQKPIAPVEVPATATGFAPENPTGPESQPSSAQTRNAQEWFPPPIAAGLAPAGTQSTTAEAVSLPRAGFWERMGAGFLDLILVAILSGLVGGLPLGLLVALAYFAGMWAWRGTTVGGIVLNLKVVRYDGQQMNFAVALVRGLMAAFSAIVFFLGFLWIAWDSEKQAWHDKLAGTVVVRQPRGSPLLCL